MPASLDMPWEEATEAIPFGKLAIDRRVQRQSVNSAHAKGIAGDFSPAAFRHLTVSCRDDGSHVIVDGQHRWEALRLLGCDDGFPVPCDVRYGLSLQQEAALFRRLNNTRKALPLDRFLVRISEGDPVAADIAAICGDQGWRIRAAREDHSLAAVDAAERVYSGERLLHCPPGDMPEALRLTLRIVTDAWGHKREGVQGTLLLGIGAVARRDGARINAGSLSAKLAGFPGGPSGFYGRAKSIALGGTNLQPAVSFAVVELHNKKARTRRLPDWHLQ